jgi:DNA polymerase-3 subunit gamma/tau
VCGGSFTACTDRVREGYDVATALYNRYRPRTFAEVVGQGHVTDALQQALRSGRLHHAYLFSGPRGCGKTSSARILAASLNCIHGPTPEPCGVCEQCTSIRTGSSIDVVEIDAASHGLVEDTRDLRERAAFMPASGRYRVFVIDEAHMITPQGFNALLKIVEEPPPYVVFVFATTDPDRVLATIRSRTFHYQFGLVPPRVLEEHLAHVCHEEGVTVESTVLPLVVRVAEGSVRDSLSVLDQLLAGVGDGGLTYAVAVARLGLTDALLLDGAVDALAARDAAGLFGVVERVVGSGQDPRRFATDLLERLRDLVLLEAVPDARERGMLDLVPADQLVRMSAQAARMGAAELSRGADVVHAALIDMRGTTTPRLVLELLCARILLPAAASDPASVLVRLDLLGRRRRRPPPSRSRRRRRPPWWPNPSVSRPCRSRSSPRPGSRRPRSAHLPVPPARWTWVRCGRPGRGCSRWSRPRSGSRTPSSTAMPRSSRSRASRSRCSTPTRRWPGGSARGSTPRCCSRRSPRSWVARGG